MARSSGPFKATEAGVTEARAYLAERGITVRKTDRSSEQGHRQQVQRVANSVYKQERAGLLPNRAAARGHGSTPEHPGRKVRASSRVYTPPKAVREAAPKAAGKELKAGRARDYARIQRQPNKLQEFPDGGRVYQGSAAFAREGVKDAAFLGQRVDIKVTYADGTTQTLFTGADHKRNGEHAIDAKTLRQMMDAYDSFEDFVADYADDDAYTDTQGTGGVVSYTVTTY